MHALVNGRAQEEQWKDWEMEQRSQGFLAQELNQPPRTQSALSEAAAVQKSAPGSELQGQWESSLDLGTERGMGPGFESWLF